jgi:iron complex transport system substrate-binding protein
VRKEKPRVSSFISADFEKILALEPDLVLTFSDLQADIVAGLIRRNVAVHAFNHRDVAGIFDMVRTLGALVRAADKAEALATALHRRLTDVRTCGAARPPSAGLFRGMGRADDLRHPLGGGADRDRRRHRGVSELSRRKNAKDHHHAATVDRSRADIIVGSWCGKKFVPAKVAARPGFADVPAVRDGFLREIKSPLILQAGPAALTDGLDALAGIIAEWAARPRA